MGFFSNFSGGKSRDDARRAYAQSQGMLEKGRARARPLIEGGYDAGISNLEDFYSVARGELGQGFDAGIEALNQGYDQGRDDLTGYFGNAEAASEDYLARAGNLLNPFIQSGQAAQSRYDDALGLNGEDAQQSFYDSYLDSPYTEHLQREAARRLNAQGQSGGGRAAAVAGRIAQEGIDNQKTRLAQQGARGGAYTTTLAGLANNTGANITSLRARLGEDLAGLEGQRGRGVADIELKRGATFGDFDYGHGRDLANMNVARGNALGNLEFGVAQQGAANRIGLGNALSSTRGTLNNNLAALGGLALKAFTPGGAGISPADVVSKKIDNIGNPFSSTSFA